MKRSRGDVERAIKSGVLDISIDVIQNPQEYMRTDKNILLHKGSYYRAVIDDRETTAIVRVEKIDGEKHNTSAVSPGWIEQVVTLDHRGQSLHCRLTL